MQKSVRPWIGYLFFSLLFLVFVLCSCHKEGFVDKRFNQELLPYSRNVWNTRLGLTGIKSFCHRPNCDASDSYQCDLIVNEIGFIEYLCHSYTHCLEPDNCSEPSKREKKISYEITDEKLWDGSILVYRKDYDANVNWRPGLPTPEVYSQETYQIKAQ